MTPSKPPSNTRPKSAKNAVFDATSVDLGDDLLSAGSETNVSENGAHAALSPSEILRNASILLREGFIEDAKKNLRSILAKDPGHAHAGALLKQIHDVELKQLLADPGRDPSTSTANSRPEREVTLASVVIDRLEKDLGIEPEDEESAALAAPCFAGGPEPLAPADLLDLGIALAEMGLFQQAVPRFEKAFLALEMESASPRLLEAAALLAYARIRSGRAFEATAALEHLLRDSDIPHETKLDLLYLMGRAYEALKMAEPARQWYLQAQALDPGYRDLDERLNPAKAHEK